MIEAKVIPPHESGGGLQIAFLVTGKDERDLRDAFNLIAGGDNISISMQHLIRIAIDAINVIYIHKNRVY